VVEENHEEERHASVEVKGAFEVLSPNPVLQVSELEELRRRVAALEEPAESAGRVTRHEHPEWEDSNLESTRMMEPLPTYLEHKASKLNELRERVAALNEPPETMDHRPWNNHVELHENLSEVAEILESLSKEPSWNHRDIAKLRNQVEGLEDSVEMEESNFEKIHAEQDEVNSDLADLSIPLSKEPSWQYRHLEELRRKFAAQEDFPPLCLTPESTSNLESRAQDFPWRQRYLGMLQRKFAKQREMLDAGVSSTEEPARVHIMGLTDTGKYIAQALANNGIPVTILMHRPMIMQDWHDEGQTMSVLRGKEITDVSGFHIESSAGFQRTHYDQRFVGFGDHLEHTSEPPETVIDTLIVATDPGVTVGAMRRIRNRLRSTSSICFVQDGLGIVQKVSQALFPDPLERPSYILANMSHKLGHAGQFSVQEVKPGMLTCTKLPRFSATTLEDGGPPIRRLDYSWSPSAKRLVQCLLVVPEFDTSTLKHINFHKKQLHQLVASAIIGPMSVIFECTNDQLLYNHKIWKYMMIVLTELSHIVRSLPELQDTPNIQKIFSVDRLQKEIIGKIAKSGKTQSHMLRAVRNGNRTDIEFTLGYLLNRAHELGIECPVTYALMLQVEGKQQYHNRRVRGYIPWEKDNHDVR
jgi:2-dehydropantoate 2-reductase